MAGNEGNKVDRSSWVRNPVRHAVLTFVVFAIVFVATMAHWVTAVGLALLVALVVLAVSWAILFLRSNSRR